MEDTASVASGGLSIKHQLYEGKHQYEVENSFKFKKANGGGVFARKGDKLLMVNDVNLQDLTPEKFALLLTKGNPMLKVHQAQKVPTDHVHYSEDTFKPISKEKTQLRFSLELKREEDLEACNERGMEGQGEDEEEEEVCQGVENRKEGDFLIVTLRKTSVSVVKGRGPATAGPCHECTGTGCAFNDVIMVSDSSSVILVPRGGGSGPGSFMCERQRNISIEHVVTQRYISSLCLQHRPIVSPNPENITIYYYKPDTPEIPFRGMPVVLNFTDSNCFLKCSRDGERMLLSVETCSKSFLKQISRSDASRLSFVFYMKATRDKQRRFESALCPGWFIHATDTNITVKSGVDDPAFFFIIH